jgi:hypothetical protein
LVILACNGEAGPEPVDPSCLSRLDDGLLAATLDVLEVVGPLLTRPVVHLDAGYDYQPCRRS